MFYSLRGEPGIHYRRKMFLPPLPFFILSNEEIKGEEQNHRSIFLVFLPTSEEVTFEIFENLWRISKSLWDLSSVTSRSSTKHLWSFFRSRDLKNWRLITRASVGKLQNVRFQPFILHRTFEYFRHCFLHHVSSTLDAKAAAFQLLKQPSSCSFEQACRTSISHRGFGKNFREIGHRNSYVHCFERSIYERARNDETTKSAFNVRTTLSSLFSRDMVETRRARILECFACWHAAMSRAPT